MDCDSDEEEVEVKVNSEKDSDEDKEDEKSEKESDEDSEDEDGEEMEILRHSLPYGDGKGEQGLFFVAYTNNLSIIDAMLKRMFGTTGDGIHDRLLHFTTAIDGAYYFAPSDELLEQVLQA